MDNEDIESTLHALRKLYGLLGKDGDTSLDFTSNALDNKSRLLLKRLLDMAAMKVFKACPEVYQVVSGQVGSSRTGYSARPLQPSDEWKQLPSALLNQSEISPMIQNSESGPDNFNYKYTRTTSHETPSTQPMLGGAESLNGSRNKSCRICKHHIAKQSTLCDPKAGNEIISLHQLNNQIDKFPELSRSPEKEKQKGLHGRHQTAIGSMEFSLNRPVTSAARSMEECKVVDSLSDEASDVIKQIELCIRNLKIGFGNSGLFTSTLDCMDGRISNFVPQTESDSPVMEANSLVPTGTEWGRIGCSNADSGDLHLQTMNEQQRDSCPQIQVPCQIMSQQMEMKMPYQISVQPPKPLPPENSMVSPGCHISGQRKDPLHGDKELNQSVDWVFGQNVKSIVAKIESLNCAPQNDLMPGETYFKCSQPNSFMITERVPTQNRAMQNDLMPSEIYNYKYLSPNKYMNSERVPDPVTFLPNQINKENLHEKQSLLNDICRRRGESRVPGDYLLGSANIQMDDTGCKGNHTWKPQNKRNLTSRAFKGHAQVDNRTPQSAGNSKWMDEEKVANPKKKDGINARRKILLHKHEYDDSRLGSSSSNWSSQEAGTSKCESEEYHAPGWKRRQKDSSPTASSESGVYSLQHRHQWHRIDTSSSPDEYSSSSRDRDDGDYELTSFTGNESNESGEYSLPSCATTDTGSSIGDSESKRSLHGQPRFQHHKQPRHFHTNLTSDKTRFRKQSKQVSPKKQVGMWKKLKDKLSIIFHHHHHHHHYHHHHGADGGDRDASNHESRVSRGKYLSKRTRKASPPVRLESHGEHEVEKLGKPLINAVPRKNQHHHFNGLVGELFRHIRHLKSSEVSAKNTKHLGIVSHEDKKPWKKQHWWQMLQRQRRVKKLGIGYDKKSTMAFSKIK